MKKKIMGVTFALLWSVLILVCIHYAQAVFSAEASLPRITLLNDVDVFMLGDCQKEITVTRLKKDDKVVFEKNGDDIFIQTNGRFIDVEKTVVYKITDGDKVELSLREKTDFLVSLSMKRLTVVPVISDDKGSDQAIIPLSVDFSGEYEGRIVATWDGPKINKDSTDFESLTKEQQSQKSREIFIHVLLALTAAVILSIPVWVLLHRKHIERAYYYALFVTSVLIILVVAAFQYRN